MEAWISSLGLDPVILILFLWQRKDLNRIEKDLSDHIKEQM
jgi:hypothetical protein